MNSPSDDLSALADELIGTLPINPEKSADVFVAQETSPTSWSDDVEKKTKTVSAEESETSFLCCW
jgi:hypothetical protein